MSDAATPGTSATSAPTDPDADQLGALCRELAEAADAVGEAAHYASRLALGSRLPVTALGLGSRRRAAWRTLLRALTDPAGLGWAARGRGVARAGWLAGVFTGRESLAVSLAVCGLKGRIRAESTRNPARSADPDAAEVFLAVEEDRQADAARAFRELVRRRGEGPAFALLNPSFADILAWNALTDDNPFNDHAGWQVATGRAVAAEPLLGIGAALRAFFDRGPACSEPGSRLLAELDTTGTPAGYRGNADRIGGSPGAVLLQQVVGPDGVERCVLQLAGPPTESGRADAPYEDPAAHVRDVAATVRRLVPSGTELALLGHGPGARTAGRLAGSREFTTVYRVTWVGSGPEPGPAAALAAFGGRVTGSHLVRLPGHPDVYVPGRPQ
ncbi:hypothetical protein OG898_30995 [Streptomyces sp. NBC_00193]|uniref:hypothetical protein n=1 Tax=unclassified Streptomyces TaxID=2593676 RepID=UPI00225B6137|nr:MULTISPECIES: hypothetical protein [unclassified Streptomyces]MCX5128267.1 hypothetical protein [Streptomyces sp. NBC_00347]MCX5300839.1 hypothetical protein [Streptomyces sp. NBC_00193]